MEFPKCKKLVHIVVSHYSCHSLSVSCCDNYRDTGNCHIILVLKAWAESLPELCNLAAAAAKSPVMSDSLQPHRRQPTRLRRPWDSPGKNTEVGCHFLLQCMKVKSKSEVAQSCPTLSDPMDCSLPGTSIHGIFQARGLEWVPLPSLV